ncbi:hypothetical protein Lfu02_56010 [Longispora fulva]|uniref:Uncharacterized protein n=1 Tax=Longispora fulva TaxID=619741 RepID=A0A8J7GU79_9ACTN|nr:hypothetical protein [Longispora fulva]MBG6137416.1 hypothetical protein [Longispora fulva]GIG61229.1 hypothetical protein Lfu02_56010 [Longispora fulva]
MTVYYSAWALPGPPERCRYAGLGLAVLTDTEALDVLRLAGGRHGHLVAVRCAPCDGWHIRPRTGHTR